jgi:cytochrome c556
MMLRRSLISLAILLGIAGAALGEDEIIRQRAQIMRQNARSEQIANQLILGKFFPDKATGAMQSLQANMTAFVKLYPGDGPADGDRASPVIWSDRADFEAQATSLLEAAKAAESVVPEGQRAFSIAWQQVAGRCRACHSKFAPAAMR